MAASQKLGVEPTTNLTLWDIIGSGSSAKDIDSFINKERLNVNEVDK